LLYGVEEEEKYTFAIPTRYGIDQSGYCVVLFRSAKKNDKHNGEARLSRTCLKLYIRALPEYSEGFTRIHLYG